MRRTHSDPSMTTSATALLRLAAAGAAATLLGGAGAAAQTGLAALKPGDVFTHCEIFCPEMAILPAGVFQMGSPPAEFGREPDEGPPREVAIDSFAIAITETTFNQWDACVADGYCRKVEEDLGWGRGRGRRPVIGVSWRDIVGTPRFSDDEPPLPLPPDNGFIAWLNAKTTGRAYRLPTEAEWEYAARAGGDTAFPTGREITADQANFNPRDPNGATVAGPYRAQTVAVGSLPPNRFGLFEMPGNVWEWVQDCYRPSYNGAPTDGRSVDVDGCGERVLRGGNYLTYSIGVRSANRYRFAADGAVGGFGFRVAYDLTPSAN